VRQCVYLLRWLVAVDIIVEVGVAEWGGARPARDGCRQKEKEKERKRIMNQIRNVGHQIPVLIVRQAFIEI
jgi:hypothetical protein